MADQFTTAFYGNLDPNRAETVFVIAMHARQGALADQRFGDWRETYGQGACEDAGGVVGSAESTIGERQVFVVRCVEGEIVYYVPLADCGELLTIDAVSTRDLGRTLVEHIQG